MAGHSKWANIKHRKERADAKKGKIFSRITKEIISAVKQGGPDPKANSKLRLVIQKAKAANLPAENIERNIKKAASADQADYTEMTYELYGHGGVGILVEVMTDNKNRSASDMRIATNKCGGTIANPGAVSYNFTRKGVIRLGKDHSEDELFEFATENGADDFSPTNEGFILYSAPEDYLTLKEACDQKGYKFEEAGIEMIPNTLVDVAEEDIEKNGKLIDWLENSDDVDAVYHNMNLES